MKGLTPIAAFLCVSACASVFSYGCSYDWGPIASSTPDASDAATDAAAAALDGSLECRGASDCTSPSEPACCYATSNGKTGSKCRSETQCSNQGGSILCRSSSECPSAKSSCTPPGVCQ
ncbi:MAG: hypothetical protein U0174_08820 [Polyangiaceae bacterium]